MSLYYKINNFFLNQVKLYSEFFLNKYKYITAMDQDEKRFNTGKTHLTQIRQV